MKIITFILSVALFCPLTAFAALTVVADLGGESTASYFEGINAAPNKFTPAQVLRPAVPPASVSISAMLPVVTSRLTPGPVNARPLTLTGMVPLFIVGDDPLSRQWLRQRAPELNALGAAGLVVNVADVSALLALQALVPELTLSPVQGDDLARRLQLTHYPVLVTGSGLAQ